MTDPGESSKAWVERHFPSHKGAAKAALILAHGAGYDAGLVRAIEIMVDQFERAGVPKEAIAKIWKRLQKTFQ